ncbi:MAG: hypothetical protein HYU53_18875 [Acidobacteria bacterium]|nr:hypothetical protein [Acidobacteriota bacterium]
MKVRKAVEILLAIVVPAILFGISLRIPFGFVLFYTGVFIVLKRVAGLRSWWRAAAGAVGASALHLVASLFT